MKISKLVRDKIPEIIAKNGTKVRNHLANDEEFWQKLKDKLEEEVDEFILAENNEELADILEVIEAICEFKGIEKERLLAIKKKKSNQRGKFNQRIILDELSDDN